MGSSIMEQQRQKRPNQWYFQSLNVGVVHRELDLERQVARLCVLPAPPTAVVFLSQKICALRVKMSNLSLKKKVL